MDTPEAWAESVAEKIAAGDADSTRRISLLLERLKEDLRHIPLHDQPQYLDALASHLATTGDQGKISAAAPVSGESPGSELPEELCRRLGLKEARSLSQDQASFFLVRGLQFLLTVDQLVWTVWKNIAPGSRFRRETRESSTLPAAIRACLEGDEDPKSAVIPALEKTRQLAAGLLGAIGPIGRTYGRRQAEKFSPMAIQDIVRREGTRAGFLGGEDVKCWRKYHELFQDLHEDSIEKEIHQAIVNYTEDLLRGTRF